MRDTLTCQQAAALDALKNLICDPATPAIVLAIDVPARAAMAGLDWPEVRRLFDERERRRRLAEAWAGRN